MHNDFSLHNEIFGVDGRDCLPHITDHMMEVPSLLGTSFSSSHLNATYTWPW